MIKGLVLIHGYPLVGHDEAVEVHTGHAWVPDNLLDIQHHISPQPEPVFLLFRQVLPQSPYQVKFYLIPG
jgi:hypothetical protein